MEKRKGGKNKMKNLNKLTDFQTSLIPAQRDYSDLKMLLLALLLRVTTLYVGTVSFISVSQGWTPSS